jgi:hypothetical protein
MTDQQRDARAAGGVAAANTAGFLGAIGPTPLPTATVVFTSVSNVLKARHDIAKNSIGN